MTEKLLSTRELSQLLGTAEVTLRRWRKTPNYGPDFLRLGGRLIRYKASSVDKWLLECREAMTEYKRVYPEIGKTTRRKMAQAQAFAHQVRKELQKKGR